MYPRAEPHYFPDNEGLQYRDLQLVKQAYESKQFKKIYAKSYLAEKTQAKPKILSLDESEVNRQLERKPIRCTGEDEALKSYFKKIEG
jgi:hypothetical protein